MPFFSRTTLERVARLAMASALLCLACGEVPRSEDTALSSERLGAQGLRATSGGRWSPTGALATARYFPTATRLPSGQVLLAGGQGAGNALLASAEVYDPATGKWSPTGPLTTARVGHVAALLPSGQVLLAGGRGTDSLASAEVYDPATGTWSATARLATARQFHTATPLPSGHVLVSGGLGPGNEFLASAELYDRVTGRWISVGPLATARQFHTATPLPSGQVLVSGGQGSSLGPLASAEVFDLELPTAGVMTPLQGSTIPDDRPTYQGTAEAESTVTLFVDGVAVGTPRANASGEWSFRQPVALRDGGHTVRARATTAAGLTGPDSTAHTFTVDTLAPDAPELSVPRFLTPQQPVIVIGTAEPHSSVTVWLDGAVARTVQADETGHWVFTPAHALPEGDHPLKATARDAAGNESPFSREHTFTLREKQSFYSAGCSTAPPLSASWALLALALCVRGQGPRPRRKT